MYYTDRIVNTYESGTFHFHKLQVSSVINGALLRWCHKKGARHETPRTALKVIIQKYQKRHLHHLCTSKKSSNLTRSRGTVASGDAYKQEMLTLHRAPDLYSEYLYAGLCNCSYENFHDPSCPF